MGKAWDGGKVAFDRAIWRAAYDVLPPGGYLLAFGGTRTYHRMVCAIEDAGFRINDCIMWLHGQGFPKNRLTQLKPAVEPIVVAQKPMGGLAVAACVQAHGTGVLNIEACRVEGGPIASAGGTRRSGGIMGKSEPLGGWQPTHSGRWPANVTHDGGAEVMEAFAAFGERASGAVKAGTHGGSSRNRTVFGAAAGYEVPAISASTGTAARFFYSAKASKADRANSTHPTVKPVALMRWLVRLVTPAGGTVLDCFAGSGTTLAAATLEGFASIGIEQDATYIEDIHRRLAALEAERPAPEPDLLSLLAAE